MVLFYTKWLKKWNLGVLVLLKNTKYSFTLKDCDIHNTRYVINILPTDFKKVLGNGDWNFLQKLQLKIIV